MIPPLPSLRNYQLDMVWSMAFHTPLVADPFRGSNEVHLSATPVLAEVSLAELHAAPNLTTVLCPTCLIFGGSNNPLPTWNDPSLQGSLVYSFFHASGDELVHIRTRRWADRQWSDYMSNPSSPLTWTEIAWYNGEVVPESVLWAVYVVVGLEIGGLSPGRERTLPNAGWDILRCWRINL